MDLTSASPLLDYTAFFRLSDPFSTRALRLTTQGISDWLTAEEANSLAWGRVIELAGPLKLRGYQGRQATDVLWTALPPLKCISLKTVAAFTERQLTGWTTFPVEVYDRQGEHLSQYCGLAITGRAGRRDQSKSTIVEKPALTSRGQPHQVYRGL
jgi:hypothetical protein